METNQTMETPSAPPINQKPVLSQDEMLAAIYEHTRKTMNYMKWQLYITLILVVLPLLSMVVLLPLVLKSFGTLSNIYGPGGLLSQ